MWEAVPTTTSRLTAEIKGARSLNRITQLKWDGICMIRLIHWTIEGVGANNFEATLLFVDFLKAFYSIIIIIMSCHLHGYPWPSLATFPYRSSPPAGLLDYIPNLHIAAVCMFELVVLLLLGHKSGSIGVHHWWVRLCFSSSVLRVWFV